MSALSILTSHGLHAAIEGDKLTVYPADRLDDELRDYIRENKPVLMQELTARFITIIRRACHGQNITPQQFLALTTEDDRTRISEGEFTHECLRAYAESFADGIKSGRIAFHPTAGHLLNHGIH